MNESSADTQLDPLGSVHTSNFPEILEQLHTSVLVTTYQAGKLVVLRGDAGVLNTHFRNLNKPMGLAHENGKLAIGCSVDIWEFHNVPAVCQKLDGSDDYPSTNAEAPMRRASRSRIQASNTRSSGFVNTEAVEIWDAPSGVKRGNEKGTKRGHPWIRNRGGVDETGTPAKRGDTKSVTRMGVPICGFIP